MNRAVADLSRKILILVIPPNQEHHLAGAFPNLRWDLRRQNFRVTIDKKRL
jgi:hypothetical protein